MDKQTYDIQIEVLIKALVEARQRYETSSFKMQAQLLNEWQALRSQFSSLVDSYHHDKT